MRASASPSKGQGLTLGYFLVSQLPPSCVRGFAAGYAIRDAGVPELPGLRTDR
jgi:hypothetical protein